MYHLVTGLIGGLVIAAPVGPIGMLCIRRSVSDGRVVGFFCGLGAATADACYGAIAAFGLTAVRRTLLADEIWLQLFGGLALVGIGIATFRERPSAPDNRLGAPPNLRMAYASTMLLTFMNPMTIVSFLAVFAGVGLGTAAGGLASSALLVLGVFLGSVAWWLVVSMAGGWLRPRLQQGGMRIVNIVAGLVIAGLGAWQLADFVRHVA